MTAYTSSQAGDWTSSATWGGAGVPGVADTASVGHAVTISTAVTCGGIALTAMLTISGSLTLAGNMTMAGAWDLVMQPGASLSLGGNTITPSSAGDYIFNGTAENRCTVTGPGSFAAMGVNVVIPYLTFVDFSGLTDVYIGRTHTSAGFIVMEDCTVDGCEVFSIDGTGAGANCGFRVVRNRFTNQSHATPVASAKYYPGIYVYSAPGTKERTFSHNLVSNAGAAADAYVYLRAAGAVAEGNVFDDARIFSGYATQSYVGNFFYNSKYESYFNNSSGNIFGQMIGNYFYYAQGNHMFVFQPATGVSWLGNIFDAVNAGVGANMLLSTSTLFSGDHAIRSNIVLGTGNLICFTANPTGGSVDLSQNTFVMDNAGQTGSGQYFPPWLLTEGAATDVSPCEIAIHSNLHVDSDDTNTADRVVDIIAATADCIDYLDYNVGWGEPAGTPTPPILYQGVSITGGHAVNDAAVDPDFVAPGRDLSVWDAARGGAGTQAAALARLRAMNSGSEDGRPADLISWVARGYQTGAYIKNGNAGQHVGAVSPTKNTTGVPLLVWLSEAA